MAKWLVIVLSALFMFAPVQSQACQNELGHEVPFPLSFPWDQISGTWEVKSCEGSLYFSFEVTSSSTGAQVLRVVEYNPRTGRVIAKGSGFANAEHTQVRAIMVGKGMSFMIFVRAFKSDAPRSSMDSATSVASPEMVLTVAPLGEANIQNGQHFELRRVSSATLRDR